MNESLVRHNSKFNCSLFLSSFPLFYSLLVFTSHPLSPFAKALIFSLSNPRFSTFLDQGASFSQFLNHFLFWASLHFGKRSDFSPPFFCFESLVNPLFSIWGVKETAFYRFNYEEKGEGESLWRVWPLSQI